MRAVKHEHVETGSHQRGGRHVLLGERTLDVALQLGERPREQVVSAVVRGDAARREVAKRLAVEGVHDGRQVGALRMLVPVLGE